jgi:signal transduction histidine kinase
MTDKLAIQRVGETFRKVGWISFWVQIVLGVIASVIVLFASATLSRNTNPGSGVGFFFAISSLVALYISTIWAFRYTRFGRTLKAADEIARPSRAEAMQLVRQGLWGNMIGMILIIIGSQALVGSLVAKSFQSGFGLVLQEQKFVQPLDLLVVQASTNAVTAHFVGMVASLWLLNRVSR